LSFCRFGSCRSFVHLVSAASFGSKDDVVKVKESPCPQAGAFFGAA
jgi:hypothetical protein